MMQTRWIRQCNQNTGPELVCFCTLSSIRGQTLANMVRELSKCMDGASLAVYKEVAESH